MDMIQLVINLLSASKVGPGLAIQKQHLLWQVSPQKGICDMGKQEVRVDLSII